MDVFLTLVAAYFLFGATIYCGVMWALRFFFYPSWSAMTVENVQDHFIIPTSAATRFFLIVVPLMFAAAAILLVAEWGEGWSFVALIVATLGIIASTVVGWWLIIPINRQIKAGVPTNDELRPLLKQWMFLNSIRWVTATVMWAAMVWYFVVRGDFIDAVGS